MIWSNKSSSTSSNVDKTSRTVEKLRAQIEKDSFLDTKSRSRTYFGRDAQNT